MLSRKTAIAAALSLLCTGAIAAPSPLASLQLGDNSAGIAFDPVLRYAFVTNYDDGTLSEIDVDTLAVTAIIPAGEKPRRVVNDAVLHRLYYVNDTSPGEVTVLDTKVNGMLARIEVGDRPRNIAADFQKGEVYVSSRDARSLSVIDVATNRVIATVETGRNPGGIEVDTRLHRIYVPSGPDGTVTIIDQNTHEVLQTIAVGRNPGAATVDERTGKVYVNNVDDRTISVLDGTGAPVAMLPSGAGSTFGTISAVYHRYYLPNATDGTLTIVDTDNDIVSSTLAVGASPEQAVVDAAVGKVYVADRNSNSIAIVDAATETAAGTFAAGVQPSRIASAMGKLFVVNENGSAADSLTIAAEPPSSDDTNIVTEYYSNEFGRYFHSADPLENRVIGDGIFGDDWNRTMEFWRVWKYAAPGRVPMCRLLGFEQDSVSHLYTPYASECETLKSTGSWQYEGTSYYVTLPDSSQRCMGGTSPLFRLVMGSADMADYRYTTDPALRDSMLASGWTADGDVFACVPELRASNPATAHVARAIITLPRSRMEP